MKIPKEMEGHFCNILMADVAVQEVKIKKILQDEIIAEYGDEEEVHIDPEYIRAWWPDPRRDTSAKNAKARAAKMIATKRAKSSQARDNAQEGTNTQEGED